MSAEVVKVATLALLSGTVWSVVPPSAKVMEPVGVPLKEVTVAVKVTDWPKMEGLADDVNEVDVEV